MSDKSKNSHIERTVYVAPTVKPGDSIHYGDWRDDAHEHAWYDERHESPSNYLGKYYAPGIPFTLIEAATGGDYSGTLVEISNAECLKRDFPWLVEVYGSHGTRGVGYLGRRENQSDALIEAIDALADYPLYDESHHSDLECEREVEAWSESHGGEYDFTKALNEYFDEIDPDYEHEVSDDTIKACALPRRWYTDTLDSVWSLWREGCECFNVNGGSGYTNEQGDSIYFYVDEWIESASKPAYPRWGDSFKQSHEHMRSALVHIARASRVTSDDTHPEQGA